MAGLRPGFFTLAGRLFVIFTAIIKARYVLTVGDGGKQSIIHCNGLFKANPVPIVSHRAKYTLRYDLHLYAFTSILFAEISNAGRLADLK